MVYLSSEKCCVNHILWHRFCFWNLKIKLGDYRHKYLYLNIKEFSKYGILEFVFFI